MLALFRRKQTTTEQAATENQRLSVKSGEDLLHIDGNEKLVRLIKRNMSITDEVWGRHYIHALKRFAELAQSHPASRNHHHSEDGGLLEHTLEVVLNAVRISRGYILPPGTNPEAIRGEEDRWRFGVFITALMHDAGKLVGDVETVYTTDNGSTYIHWQPWYGAMPMGAKYVFRYPPSTEKKYAGLHERLSITLLPHVLTPAASAWLREKPQLMSQILATLSASKTEGGVISEIIKKADHSSTGANLTPTTGVSSETLPQHQLLLNTLVRLAGDGTFKRNQPGSHIWVTEHVTWVVGKAAMETVRAKLAEEGHKGLPQSTSRLIQIINEFHHTIDAITGEDMWQAIITDKSRNWEQKLSFMVFPNETIWPSATPSLFAGKVTPADGKGKAIDADKLPVELYGLAESSQSSTKTPPAATPAATQSTAIDDSAPAQATGSETDVPAQESQQEIDADTSPDSDLERQREQAIIDFQSDQETVEAEETPAPTPPTPKQKPKADAAKAAQNVSVSPSAGINQHPMLKWMATRVKYHKIRVNESGAPVHIIDGYVALVTPAIFDRYLEDNKTSARALGRDRDSQLRVLQSQIRALGLHEKSSDGGDFHTVYIAGPNKQSTLNAFLFKRHLFPEFEGMSRNTILRLE